MIAKGLFLLVCLPVLTGVLGLFLKTEKLRKNPILLVLFLGFITSIFLFSKLPQQLFTINLLGDYNLAFGLSQFSKFILIFINFFGVLVCMYSKDDDTVKGKRVYFSYLIWLIAFSNLVCFSADFITFIFSWGAALALLYAFLSLGSGSAANKALSIVGFGDFSLILGVCLYIFSTGTTAMPAGMRVALDNPLHWSSFILMLIGAFAKSGCAPLHTWIPAISETTPMPVMAILPASLDKLLGIYLLTKICLDFFVLNKIALALLLLIGSFTIIFAVMMALIQHDLRKLLSYHAISQVGYMVLGFGTGTPIGVLGALFHMLNNAIYKSGLFLTGASVGGKKNTFELDKLGGLAKSMPITFITGLVFALSISGLPLSNGFVSKWMLYQGVIIGLSNAGNIGLRLIYLLALITAMFGSALTLASFIKFIHAIFLGEDKNPKEEKLTEVSGSRKIPVLVLAGLCVILGAVPNLFLKNFLGQGNAQSPYLIGIWNAPCAFFLILTGLFLGFVFWRAQKGKNLRQDSLFIGGEEAAAGQSYPATEFYKGLEDMPLIKKFYRVIKIEAYDFYNLLSGVLKIFSYILLFCVDRLINLLTGLAGYIILGLSWIFRKLHTGVLDLYIVWSLLGLLAFFMILMR
ncbi:MAG: proton-conducting transporter membrane subunit [Candidatus Omnitrophota bacterium]